MKKIVTSVFAFLLAMSVVTGCANKATGLNMDEMKAIAREHVSDMLQGDFNSVAADFDRKVAKQLSSTTLKTSWDDVTASLGKHLTERSIVTEEKEDYFVCVIIHEFENTGLKITLSYNASKQIAGLFLNYQAITSELISNENFEEIKITIGDKLPLNGVLTLPSNVDKPPVVMLVHGSGTSDKNETIMVNTPFKDIAHALTQQGVATLRYDKRFFTYPEEKTKMGANLTLREEVLDDARVAIDLLSTDKRVGDIYVLGHSLGGMLAPVIAYENKSVKGIVSMAGTLRPLYELSYDQNKDVEKGMLEGEIDRATLLKLKLQMKQVEKDIVTLRGNIASLPNEKILLGLPVGYQKSVKEYAGELFIEKISLPILVLQGSEDFQVYANKDYRLWEEALKGRNNVTLKLYSGLNHLMMQTNGKKDISEYQIKGVVDKSVIDDIAEFVN